MKLHLSLTLTFCARFVDSELDLDEELKKMHAVAASPELYPVVVKLGSLASITQLLLHENIGP
jgi:beta-catenin-like protein 1